MRRVTAVWIASVGIATLLLGQAPGSALADSSGNAGIKLEKTIESTSINPVLALTLQADKSQAIPGDSITYSGSLTNTGAKFGLTGRFTAAAHADTDATVVYYWDELQTCLQGCGNGVADPHWTALVAFVASQPGYQPVQPPAVSSGLSLAATPVPSSGVTYPAAGDAILGTDIGPKAIGIWKYQASATLTPAQVAVLSDPNQVQAVRNVIHFEVAPRNSQAAQPFDDDPQLANPLQSQANAAAAANAVVTVTTPDGAKVQVTSSTVPALASLAPGASASYSTSFKVPVVTGKAGGESDADYLKRLGGIEGSRLSATASATGTGLSGQVSASAGPVTTTEHLPIVGITKSGPGGATAGSTVSYQLSLQNSGGAQAASLAVNDTLSDGGVGAVSGVPASLAAGATGTAQVGYAIPGTTQGTLTDTASVRWKDANGNSYGSVSSAFSTQVSRTTVAAIMPVTTTPVLGHFFAEPDAASTFIAKPGDSAAFSQSFPTINFNPPTGVVPANSSGVGPKTHPFTDVTTDLIGNFSGSILAQGNGVQAGVGSLNSFDAVFTATMNVAQASDVTFNVVADDGFLLGFGGGAIRVSGTYENAPASNATAFNGFPLVAAFNEPSIATPAPHPVTVHFPAAGSYPYELDYFECGLPPGGGFTSCGSQLSLTMTVASVIQQTSPLSVYVGYADGLRPAGSIFPFPWNGSPNVTFVGCTTCPYDAGAIRFDNSSDSPIALDSVTADVDSVHFDIWPHGLTVPAHQILILTQTQAFNFDSSDFSTAPCGVSNHVIPKINVTIAGVTTTYDDSQEVLNTGGFDLTCKSNESESWQHIGGGGTPISVPLPPAVSLALTPASVSGDVVGQSQTFAVAAMDGSGQPVPNLPVTLGVFGANIQQLSATTDGAGLASFSYPGTAPGTDTVTATAFISGLQAVSNAASIPWNVPSGGSSTTVTTTITPGSAPPSIRNVRPAIGAVIGAATPVTATITAAAGITSWVVTSQAVPTGGPVTLASGTGAPPATLATFDPKGLASGTYAITISATAGGGSSASATVQVFIGSGGGTAQQAPPSISAPTPADGAIVTKPIPISASFTPPAGQTIAAWSVTYQGQSNPTIVSLASGTGAPPATLATFDPTLLPNDTYVISISATASGGGTEAVTSTVSVKANLKLGRYVTTYTDLGVPVNGFQMDIERTYDSIDKSVGDFGVGWRVSVANFRTGSNRTLGAGGWSMYAAGCGLLFCNYAFKTSTPHFVTVTFPDTHQEIFDFTPTGGVAFTLFFGGTAAFAARPGTGTTSTLQALGDPGLNFVGDGNLYGSNGQPYDPQQFKLTTHDGRVLVLDRTLGLVSETDRNGNSLTIDAGGVHSSSGTSITFSRDAQHRITSIKGPAGESLSYSYSGSGDLASAKDGAGNVTSFTYDAGHNLLGVNGPGGPFETLTYDSSGRLTAVTDANGNMASVASNVSGRQQVVTDFNGQLTTVDTFDDFGDVIQRDQTFGSKTVTTASTYDAVGNPLTETDPLGHTATLVYDANGQIVAATDADGRTVRIARNAFGQPTSRVGPDGRTTLTATYDSHGNLVAVAVGDGSAYTFAYDSAGNLVSQTDPLGRTTQQVHDSAGHVTQVTDPAGHVIQQSFDASGRIVSVTNALGATTTYTYDGAGDVTRITDPLGRMQSFNYNFLGQITAGTDALGHTTTYQYDAAGNLVQRMDRNGDVTRYTYNADRDILSKTLPGGVTTTYSYDALRRLTSLANSDSVIQLTYDNAGNLLTQTSGGTASSPQPEATLTYTYDAAGYRISVTGPEGTTSYAYDAAVRLGAITTAGGGVLRFGYDSADRLVSLSRPNGASDVLAYDSAGELLSKTTTTSSTILARVAYSYDLAGRRTSLTDPSGTTTFTYDAAGQLTAATHPAISGLGAEVYTYDAAGNRTSSATSPLGTMTYDAGSRLAADAHFGYAYDNEGNLVARTDRATGAVTTYVWNADHQLVGVQHPDGTKSTYRYDPMRRRIEVGDASSVTRYVWDGLNVHLEYDGANTLKASYTTAMTMGSVFAMSRSGGAFYDVQDALDTTTTQLDASGATAATYTYDAFGNPAPGNPASPASAFGFAGVQLDAGSGLYYSRARYYDPRIGRFISQDPIESANPYMYVNNDPTDITDPSGATSAEQLPLNVQRRLAGSFVEIYAQALRRSVALAAKEVAGYLQALTRTPAGRSVLFLMARLIQDMMKAANTNLFYELEILKEMVIEALRLPWP